MCKILTICSTLDHEIFVLKIFHVTKFYCYIFVNLLTRSTLSLLILFVAEAIYENILTTKLSSSITALTSITAITLNIKTREQCKGSYTAWGRNRTSTVRKVIVLNNQRSHLVGEFYRIKPWMGKKGTNHIIDLSTKNPSYVSK